ncbi:MAG: nucleotidyltransferase family protein [Chloroflexi bacterium]|nr:nucleotidyltransferase family protein [Chloroflexota bacterium]
MGRPKMLLPWGQTTVLGQVVATLSKAELGEILVVGGGMSMEIAAGLDGTPARLVLNPDYANGEMLSSLQVGLANLNGDCQAALIVLGDQPQIELIVVQAVLRVWDQEPGSLVVPSYKLRRGHPWLLPRSMWAEIFSLQAPATLRDFLNAKGVEIHYVPVDTPSIHIDLDTPEDYRQYKPG